MKKFNSVTKRMKTVDRSQRHRRWIHIAGLAQRGLSVGLYVQPHHIQFFLLSRTISFFLWKFSKFHEFILRLAEWKQNKNTLLSSLNYAPAQTKMATQGRGSWAPKAWKSQKHTYNFLLWIYSSRFSINRWSFIGALLIPLAFSFFLLTLTGLSPSRSPELTTKVLLQSASRIIGCRELSLSSTVAQCQGGSWLNVTVTPLPVGSLNSRIGLRWHLRSQLSCLDEGELEPSEFSSSQGDWL